VIAAKPYLITAYKKNHFNFELIREEVIYSTHKKKHHNLNIISLNHKLIMRCKFKLISEGALSV